jgi:hypothetical protein
MNLFERIRAILVQPRQTWPVIDTEPATPASLYAGYIALLAAVPAIAGFIGLSLVGVGGIVSFRVPIVSGLVQMVVGYALSLALVYVLSLIVNALAPKFGGQRNGLAALKLVAYGATAGFLGGIFSIVPALGVLGILAALYSIYLIYTGLPVLMKCPPEKAVAYTAVVILCGILASLLIGLATAFVTPGGGTLAGLGAAQRETADVTIKVPGTDISVNSRQFEEAAKRIEQAQAAGDSRAAGEATAEMIGAAIGAATGHSIDSTGAAIPTEALRGHVPEAVAGLARQSLSAEGESVMGISQHEVRASFGAADKTLDVVITDHSGIGRVAATAWAARSLEREDAEEVERIYRKGSRAFHETWRKDGSGASLLVLLDNGVQVKLQGSGVGIEALREALPGLDLDALAATKRQK